MRRVNPARSSQLQNQSEVLRGDERLLKRLISITTGRLCPGSRWKLALDLGGGILSLWTLTAYELVRKQARPKRAFLFLFF